MLYGNSLCALCFHFVQKFSDARLQVLGNLLTVFSGTEIVAERLLVSGKHLVSILVDIKKASTKVDCDILFHCFK